MAKRRHLLRHFLKPQAARFFDELRILARFVQPQLEDVQAEAKKIYAAMLMTSLDSFKVFATYESRECFSQVLERYSGSDGGRGCNDLNSRITDICFIRQKCHI